jgi:GTP-binding protein
MPARVEPVTSGLPVVAIVGRPNVGKSTLFNRIVGSRRAIVDDAPGVTRDRVVAPAAYEGRTFLCVDTGGFHAENPRDPADIDAQVRGQALAAIEEASVIICVVDGHAGLAPVDHDTVRLLERSRKPVFVAVNKIDGTARDGLVHDFHALGVDRLFPISSAHNRGIDDLLDVVVAALPAHEIPAPEAGTRLALVGRPNVGKSSLLNRLLGTERTLVSPRPGTTRDAIDTPVVANGRPYVLIDTAGIRRRSRVESQLERHGAVRALGMLERADIALVVLDASEGMTDQDARIVGRALEAVAASSCWPTSGTWCTAPNAT